MKPQMDKSRSFTVTSAKRAELAGVKIPRKEWLYNPMKFMFDYYNKSGIVTMHMNPGEVCKFLNKKLKVHDKIK